MVHSNSYHGTLEYHGTPTIYNFFIVKMYMYFSVLCTFQFGI